MNSFWGGEEKGKEEEKKIWAECENSKQSRVALFCFALSENWLGKMAPRRHHELRASLLKCSRHFLFAGTWKTGPGEERTQLLVASVQSWRS